MTLSLISIGLHDERDLSLRGIKEARECDVLYAELYTTRLSSCIESLSRVTGRDIEPLSRRGLEEESDKLLEEAEEGHIGIFVGGDCLSATTHISLTLEAKRRGIDARIIHGSSIFTAIAETGLSIYKFGGTVTLPLPDRGPVDSVTRVIRENREWGLHTLILLDLDIESERYLTIPEGLDRLLESGDLPPDTLAVGVARLGSSDPVIKANSANLLRLHDFGDPPHALVVPGRLHFLEAEALEVIASCPEEVIEGHEPMGELDRLITKYTKGCIRVIKEMERRQAPYRIDEGQVDALIDHVERYIEDAEYYTPDRKPVALTSISYAEGILDALKLMKMVEFEW
ncbi:MAG: diphthine synthase [Candidatus Bathyarchaeia archaeon]